jgi:hypothetical protein
MLIWKPLGNTHKKKLLTNKLFTILSVDKWEFSPFYKCLAKVFDKYQF